MERDEIIYLAVVVPHQEVRVYFGYCILGLKLCQYIVQVFSIGDVLLEFDLKPFVICCLFNNLHRC